MTDITVPIFDIDLQIGADYSPPSLVRQFYPYAVKADCCGGILNACTGLPAPITDMVAENYTGCTATMVLRAGNATGTILYTLTTANNGITLNGDILTRLIPASITANFPAGVIFGHIDVTRPSGAVERQYTITCNAVA